MSSFSFKEHAIGPQSIDKTLLILSYEASKVANCALEIQLYGERGYTSAMLTEISDCISMLRYYCELTGQDLEEPNTSIKGEELKVWIDSKQLEGRIYTAVGDLIRSYHYNTMFGSTLYHLRLETCVANLRRLLRQWCIEHATTWLVMATLGEEHYLERMSHLESEGIHVSKD